MTPLRRHTPGEQAIVFLLDHGIALAGALFESLTIEHRNLASSVTDEPRLLQVTGRLRDSFAAYTQHIGNEFLRHYEMLRAQAVQA